LLDEYRQHVKERADLGIVPEPLNAEQTAALIDLIKKPPEGDEEFILDLLINRVPAGVDQAAYIKAAFLAAITEGEAESLLIDKIKASVPVAQPTEYFTLANLENFFSNFSTFFPSIKSPFLTVDKRDLLIFDCSFLENGLTSVNFIIKFSLNILLDYLRRYLFF